MIRFGVSFLPLLWLLCWPGSTPALEPPARYGDAIVAPPPGRLPTRIYGLVAEVALAERRETPKPEAHLELAAQEIVRHLPDDGPPSNDLVDAALRLYGIVEPPPHLIMVSMAKGGE